MSWRTISASGAEGSNPRRVAVIDLGSNSWRLVVFSYVPGSWWKRTDELHETVRIGQGLDASGRLSEAAMERGLETIEVFGRYCAAHGLAGDCVHTIATSAVRDAGNGEEFLAEAQRRSGLAIEVLPAAEEARIGYVAAINTTTLSDGAVVELGGGSLQLVEVADRQAGAVESFPLGALRLTESFLPGPGPARRKELERLRKHVRASIAEVSWLEPCGPRLVGAGGSARNLAAAVQHAGGGIDIGVQGFVITAQAMNELVAQLGALPVSERGEIPGIKPGRGDIILAAAVALQTVMRCGDFAGLEVTEAGLREGVFFGRTLAGGGDPLLGDVRWDAVRNLAVQYESDLPHIEHVAALSLQMHDSLSDSGLIKPRPGERELLWAAAMLHDVGMTISYDDHHKHSRYLIVSAELPGFDPRERALIAQITRYHRKGAPKLGELEALTREGDEPLLERCSMILRLAEHLERGRDQSVREVRLQTNGDGVDLHLLAAGDLTLPRWSVERYGDGEAFRKVFNRRLLIG